MHYISYIEYIYIYTFNELRITKCVIYMYRRFDVFIIISFLNESTRVNVNFITAMLYAPGATLTFRISLLQALLLKTNRVLYKSTSLYLSL